MASISTLYKEATGETKDKIEETVEENERKKLEEAEVIKWANWRSNPVTEEFIKILNDARTEILAGKFTDKSFSMGIPDLLVSNPMVVTDRQLIVKMAELGTIQRILRATVNGKYNI